ncbi:MAG: ribulose-phosphate 3-epimerase, partial [Clostridia bacterium]|nr:ribulose-phosphate 3-epimerase [Clostridia bacterium]
LCDFILVMTVEPGFGGQSLIPECLDKVAVLKKEIAARGLSLFIEVDGGINEKTAPRAREVGSDVMVAGSSVFGAEDMAAAMRTLRGE